MSFLQKYPKSYRWTMIAYVVLLVVFTLPRAIRGVPLAIESIFNDYKTLFTGEESAGTGALPPARVEASVEQRILEIEQSLAAMNESPSASRLDSLAVEIRELERGLFGDPETALTIQRLNIEYSALSERVDSIGSQMQWLFGITLTLALGVLGTVIGVIKSTFAKDS